MKSVYHRFLFCVFWHVSVCFLFSLVLFLLADRYVLVGSRHGSWYEGALADWGNGAAVMTQIIVSMMAQARAGWQPDRTIVFCSWGGTSLGSVGSFEWGKVICQGYYYSCYAILSELNNFKTVCAEDS